LTCDALRKVEAIADSLASLNDYYDPESEAYKLRNPGMIRKYRTLGMKTDEVFESEEREDGKLRTFTCHQAGYKALTDLIGKHCARRNEKSVQKLFSHFGHGDESSVKQAVDFMRLALNDKAIHANTRLRYFVEQSDGS
jgi:hypothetical protein